MIKNYILLGSGLNTKQNNGELNTTEKNTSRLSNSSKKSLIKNIAFCFLFLATTFSFAQTVTIGAGTSTQRFPLGSVWGFERSASIYTPVETSATGDIFKLAWYSTTANTASRPIKIYLKTTADGTFTASTWASQVAGATLVYDSSKSISIGWNEFILTTQFNYAGTDNLLVLVETNAGGGGISGSAATIRYSSATGKHMNLTADTTAPSGNGSVSASRPNIQVSFASTVAPNCTISPIPAASAVNVALNPTLSWTDGGGGATSYDLYFGTTTNPSLIANQTATSFAPAILAPSTTYYWKVVAKNAIGDAAGCVENSFTTGTELTYCNPSSTLATTYIDNFSTTLGSTNISNLASGYSPSGYQNNFGTTSVTSYPTSSFNYNFTIAGGTVGAAIWIDWNSNGVFETTERVFVTTSYGSGPFSGTITIPAGTNVGDYRMRVLVDYNSSAPANPCISSNTRVEAEDYKISVIAQPACSGAPDAATIVSSLANVCVSGSVTLTATVPVSTDSGFLYQWYNTAGIIAGATATTYTTPVLSAAESYYFKTTCTNSGLSVDSNTVSIGVNNPEVLTTIPNSRCGVGTVDLSATASTGATLNWYANATGGTPLASGPTFTTPSISATTTFYVAASEGTTSENGAKLTTAGADGSFVANAWGIVFNATSLLNLESTVIYPTGTGTITVGLYDSTGTELASTAAIPVSGTGIATPVILPLNFVVAPGTGYRLLVKAYTGITGLIRDSSGGYPYNSTNTSVTGSWNGSATTGAYYFFYNLAISTRCTSARTAVVGTVTTPPALTLSAPSVVICQDDSSAVVAIASGATDYNTFVWSPATGVTGDAVAGWIFNPTVSTTYTLTASQTTGTLCSTVIALNVTVNNLPSTMNIAPTAPVICADGIQALSVTGGTIGVVGKIGTGTATNTASTPYRGFYGGSKTQALYTASELTAVGITAGQKINSIGFVALSGTPNLLTDFSIKAGFVSNNSLGTAFINGASNVVLASAAYIAPVGSGNLDYSLSIPLVWDGVSNLLIETCFNNNNSGGAVANSVSLQSSTVSSGLNIYRSQDSTVDVCSNSAAVTTSTNRPNLRISTLENSDITWSPTTNLYTDAAATIAYTGSNATTVYVKSATAGSQTYTATATVPLTGCETSATVSVTVNALPVTTVTRTGDTLTTAEAGATYQWILCDGSSTPIAGETNQTFVATATGSYAVIVTKNGCSVTSDCFDVTTLSSNSFDLTKLSYYPNPVIDMFTVTYVGTISNIQVYDISGRLVKNINANANEVAVDMSDMAASVYIVKVAADNTSGEFKVIKK